MKVKLNIRGGVWDYVARHARCAVRFRLAPGGRDGFLGFRCCFPNLRDDKGKVRNES